MRSLAAFFAAAGADVFAVCEIEAGDALALATRFAAEWAYRGRQAIFWNARFLAREIADVYLPVSVARPLDRRGFLRVDGSLDAALCALYTMQLAADRHEIAQRRFVRTRLRSHPGSAIVFARAPRGGMNLADLGFIDAAPGGAAQERILARGFRVEGIVGGGPLAGLGTPIRARLTII
ncbi:MAG: hypothetical protein M3Y18_02545 [Candidatus Eremiobacteraeota bacterium]|nr:hypothetical protein [Candidatus Eremiobacteraeota bacterium]